MGAFTCAIITTAIGAILVIVLSVVGFVVIPDVVRDVVASEVALEEDTIQMERFMEIPFPLNLTVHFLNINNVDQVKSGGTPDITQVGPYVYSMKQRRVVLEMDSNTVTYQIVEELEFDEISSYPNLENDTVTILNPPYHSILQVAAVRAPGLMSVLNLGLDRVFGEYNTPFATFNVRDILFDGINICVNPGIVGRIACDMIRETANSSQSLQVMPDGSVRFALLAHKHKQPGKVFVVDRGLQNIENLGKILKWNSSSRLNFWTDFEDDDSEDTISSCNQINGTDTGIYPPFIDREKSSYGFNPDICRSVELRYQSEENYEGIPVVRFAAREWFLDNNDGCFCLNVTQPHECMLKGVMELYSCVGAYMVLSYPHFLFADLEYQNSVIGLNANEDEHMIFLDREPNSGTVVRGAKRAQFNLFSRPIHGISATQSLRTTLTPIFWVQESVAIPEEFVEEIKTKVINTLRIVDIVRGVLIGFAALVFAIGAVFIIKIRMSKSEPERIVGLGNSAQIN